MPGEIAHGVALARTRHADVELAQQCHVGARPLEERRGGLDELAPLGVPKRDASARPKRRRPVARRAAFDAVEETELGKGLRVGGTVARQSRDGVAPAAIENRNASRVRRPSAVVMPRGPSVNFR